jgi:SAM-dependent methyltransferase
VRRATKGHWERFWLRKQDVEQVYSNSGRLGREIEGVAPIRGRLVLEVGGGTGRDGEEMARRDARVVEVDYAWSSLSIIHQRSAENGLPVHAVAADAFRLPFSNDRFDVVFHQGLLEHFRPPRSRQLLLENARVLTPGGLLCVDVPQRWHPYTLLKHGMMAVDRWFAGWERSFSLPELRRAIEDVGLVVVHEYGEWLYPSLGYRVVREAMKPVRVALPLYPQLSSATADVRRDIRERPTSRRLARWTGQSIGVIARKP